MTETTPSPVRILVLEHDPSDPLLRLGEWLAEAGAVTTVCRPHLGEPIPQGLTGFHARAWIRGISRLPDIVCFFAGAKSWMRLDKYMASIARSMR